MTKVRCHDLICGACLMYGQARPLAAHLARPELAYASDLVKHHGDTQSYLRTHVNGQTEPQMHRGSSIQPPSLFHSRHGQNLLTRCSLSALCLKVKAYSILKDGVRASHGPPISDRTLPTAQTFAQLRQNALANLNVNTNNGNTR